MADAAVDRNEQVRDIIFDAIKSIRMKSKRPDIISMIQYITRNPTNFEEAELRDSISKLDSGILINKKTKQDLDSLFVNEWSSTDNTSQGQNNTLTDITPVDIATPNCTLVETSTKSDSNKYNNLKGEVNNSTANFAAVKSFVLDELHEIKEKVYTKLHTIENMQNDRDIDDVIEVDGLKTRQIFFVKSSKSTIKKRPEVAINQNPENQDIFGKEDINAKRRQETYTDAVSGVSRGF